ncbi:hypothetical protein BLNAU_5369 [Blattamonas nauphoetae]|uniref:CH-like domain-containing protein n=1 Tax=Blattamonas nauphoetae TaxID=2049346 RepID=A0ABQ9Y743_9EUKA|nr:hypothetical protein BLNAU_5369 [Blattamonas nauphoetae]
MNTIVHTTDASPSTTRTELASAPLPFPVDSSPFLNWREDQNETDDEKAVVFQSLVATLKCQPVLDASLEAKAVKFLESVDPPNAESADDFLDTLASITDESMTEFVQSIVTLISSPSLAIIKAAMKMLKSVVSTCSDSFLLVLLEADLIPTLITSLNLQSLSFTEAEDIHTCLMITFVSFLWLATPFSLPQLEIKDDDGQQAVHETVLQQVIAPSENPISAYLVDVKHLDIHNYPESSNTKQKELNWRTFRTKVLKKTGMNFLTDEDIMLVASNTTGVIEWILHEFRKGVEAYFAKYKDGHIVTKKRPVPGDPIHDAGLSPPSVLLVPKSKTQPVPKQVLKPSPLHSTSPTSSPTITREGSSNNVTTTSSPALGRRYLSRATSTLQLQNDQNERISDKNQVIEQLSTEKQALEERIEELERKLKEKEIVISKLTFEVQKRR